MNPYFKILYRKEKQIFANNPELNFTLLLAFVSFFKDMIFKCAKKFRVLLSTCFIPLTFCIIKKNILDRKWRFVLLD